MVPDIIRLSYASISSLVSRRKDYFVKDAEVHKMQLKVTPVGNKSFIVRYRNLEGRERKYKLGDFPDINASTARRVAKEILARVALGGDPKIKGGNQTTELGKNGIQFVTGSIALRRRNVAIFLRSLMCSSSTHNIPILTVLPDNAIGDTIWTEPFLHRNFFYPPLISK